MNDLKKETSALQEEGKRGLELKLAKHNLEILQQKEEEFWRIRSRSNWLAYGEKILSISSRCYPKKSKNSH